MNDNFELFAIRIVKLCGWFAGKRIRWSFFFFMWSKCWMYSIACYFCVSLTYAHYLCLTLSCTVFSIICNRIRWNKCIYKHTKKWYVRGSRFAQISIFSLLLFDVFFFFFISKMSTITNEEKSTNDPTLLLAQYLS